MTGAATTAQAAPIIVNSAWDGLVPKLPGAQPPRRLRDAINFLRTQQQSDH